MKTKTILFIFILCSLFADICESQWMQNPISAGPFDNYQISTANGYLETDIIVNPRNPLNFVCTDNRLQYISGAPHEIFYTTNGGVNWLSTIVPPSNWDPSFAADSLGNFYLAIIQSGGNAVQVSKSTNGGVSWTILGNVINTAGADKPSIIANQTTGPYQNNVYILYRNATTSLDFWRSTNNGGTWSFVTNVLLGFNGPPTPEAAIGPDGRIAVSWFSGSGNFARISTDGGGSFGPPVSVSNNSPPGAVNCSGYNVLKGNVRAFSMPHLAFDMTNGPYRGYIYHVYAANPAGPDAADIFMTKSTDGGTTWNTGSPVRINDDTTMNDQFIPDVSVDAQGRVWAIWFDSRDDSANNLVWTYGAVSTNGGVSFIPNFKISSQSFDPAIVKIPIGPPCLYYLGDYQGISGKTFTLPCYAGQNNTHQDFTAYLPDYGMSFALQTDSTAAGDTSYNVVRIPLMGPYSGTVTYTANVSPPPSQGMITFTWIPGNVKTINGVPDSLILDAIVSSQVPIREYTVSVTGTESNGPRAHTRSWSLNVTPPIGISSNQNEIPREYKLEQNYPNPFNSNSKIKIQIPELSDTRVTVYDMLGREVENLVNQLLKPGIYEFNFNATNYPSGVYYYKMTSGKYTKTKKMILLK